MKHTPGPWKVSHNAAKQMGGWKTNPYSIVVPAKGVHRTTVANIPNRETISEDQKRANAFLIAAAPDLLGWLQFATKILGEMPGISNTWQVDQMRAAIAKATGEQQ